jgi:molybdate transport system regulatory protein
MLITIRQHCRETLDKKKTPLPANSGEEQPPPLRERAVHGSIIAGAECSRCLDTVQLDRLEQSFRDWVQDSNRSDVRLSRQRILLIFLLIRYTGARLSEVLALDPFRDLQLDRQTVIFGRSTADPDQPAREVQLLETLAHEIRLSLNDGPFKESLGNLFQVDPGHVRRKFYDRAAACGFPKELGGPDALRRSRAVELLQNNMPLPVVQRILGHSTPNLTAALVSFSEADMQQVARFFLEKESGRKTSARNRFFGKILKIRKGDIQARVEMITLPGDRLTTMITNDSLARLGLKVGRLITAEVKAPWVILQKGEAEPVCSAENRFYGTVSRIISGRVTAEYVVRIADGTELCSLVSSDQGRQLDLHLQEPVWVLFNAFAVVLHVD